MAKISGAGLRGAGKTVSDDVGGETSEATPDVAGGNGQVGGDNPAGAEQSSDGQVDAAVDDKAESDAWWFDNCERLAEYATSHAKLASRLCVPFHNAPTLLRLMRCNVPIVYGPVAMFTFSDGSTEEV